MDSYLWGSKSRLSLLLGIAALLLFTFLGAKEIWTHENRWSNVVMEMVLRHDYWHPILREGVDYYGKPLFTYWLIILSSKLLGSFSTFALRLPSAMMGLLAVWSIFQLGSMIKRPIGFLAGWMLLTTGGFIFWSRTSTADIHTLALSLFSTYWYYAHKDNLSFKNYCVFLVSLAINGICKGLIGPVITLLAIFPDFLLENFFKKVWQHMSLKFVVAATIAFLIYLIPFACSAIFSGNQVGIMGLQQVFAENYIRFTHPWNHAGPVYLYTYILPYYLLPWTFFFIPMLITIPKRWSTLEPLAKRNLIATGLIFLVLTISKSRRDYYLLPILPYAILNTAEWIYYRFIEPKQGMININKKISSLIKGSILFLLLSYALLFGIINPIFYSMGGAKVFAKKVHNYATQLTPWENWKIVALDARFRDTFYLFPAKPPIYCYETPGTEIYHIRASERTKFCPQLGEENKYQLFITAYKYLPIFQVYFPKEKYHYIDTPPTLGDKLLHKSDKDRSIAFIPKS